MDVQAVLKRITCLVQISKDEVKMINDPILEPSHRILCLARLIKDKRMGKRVYKMLRDLYCISERNTPGCYSTCTCMACYNVLFPQSLLIHPVVSHYPSSQLQPMFMPTIITTTTVLL